MEMSNRSSKIRIVIDRRFYDLSKFYRDDRITDLPEDRRVL